MEVVLVILVLAGTALLSWPLGRYLAWAMDPPEGAARAGLRGRFEGLLARLDAAGPPHWKRYAVSLLVFNVVTWAWAYAVLVTQHLLPLNPDGKGPMEPSLAFNTVSSFVTNTNLQHYSGEVALSYFSQLAVICWLQFVSAATGIAALTALCRALAGREVGGFFRDLGRACVLVLLPLSLVLATLLILGGIPMTFEGAAVAHTLEGAMQTIARGPVAAVVAIKQLGTNGGGYFGPNSTHPFENAGFFTNVVSNVSILLIPMGVVWMFGRITGRRRHAAVVFAVMGVFLVIFASLAIAFETAPAPALAGLPVTQAPNLEGKELRFGAAAGPLWAVSTTATSNGSVNSMHDSLNPLTGLLPLTGMWLNVIYGGVGVGFINMFLFIVVAVFIAGLMVGRTPEYLTRKVEASEMKLAALALLLHPFLILAGTALFAATPWGQGTVKNPGSHGFSEILYEFSSAAANNGSGFEGLGDNTAPWNVATGLAMLFGRFLPIFAPLAIAASLGRKRPTPETTGTFRTDGLLFGVVLFGTVLLVGALLFLPVAILGPIADHLAPL
ncbi:MAG TPA: potassium-transporting ATPase subunit KdpA [Thermoanaerobaculia bacterium]|jgi:K+-transporting ATPase ATPase A chain